jgi:hypothetical protein
LNSSRSKFLLVPLHHAISISQEVITA